MTTFQSFQPRKLVNFPINNKPTLYSNQQHRVNYYYLNPRLHHNTSLRFSLNNDVSATDGFIHELFGRTEILVYTLADALASAKQSEDWLYGITNLMETVLKVLKDGLSALHVPYAYGFAIILLTVLVKAATFPLTKKQVESAMAMKSLQPQVNAIQKQFAGDQERIQLETARLYKIAGVNPLAGCLPTIATIPVWVGLYRALSNVANEGLLTEGFFWIPSLAGPTTIAAKQNGSGISWIFPFVDGHPPLGWSDTLGYLVLPLLLILSQYISVQIMQSSQNNDPNLKASQALSKFLPLMIGYFALSVPSGLSLYWFTNNILSTTQQIWLQKLGGAKSSIREFSDKNVKEVQKKLKGSVDKENSTNIMESRKEEKPSGGMRPGDRFKQIKEQEARKKEQMDEEKRKLAAITTESADKKLESVKTEDEATEAESVDVRDEIVKSLTAASEPPNQVPLVNGEHSFLSSNEDQKDMSLPRAENGVVASTASDDGKEELLLHENLEKDEATGTYTTTTPTGGVDPSKTAEHGRIEQPTKGDEN